MLGKVYVIAGKDQYHMLAYPHIDPVLVSLGPLKVHWYGMMYLCGFVGAFWLAQVRCRRSDSPVQATQVEDLILYAAFGVVLGGRIGYVFFYGFDQLVQDPLWLFRVWQGGMSFHGGLLGVLVAMVLYARKIQRPFSHLTDFIAALVPIGLGFGRIGNFINQELWGRPTDVSWAMVFPNDPLLLPRHPSQLYQAALEGVLLFTILFVFSQKPRPRHAVSGLFLLCYGLFRFSVEFFREPDSQIGFELFGWMTRGQELCLPMMVAGLGLLWFAYTRSGQPEGR
jgi:phosphatidylglycerol---prolipoprotein diacylglyceryl transferase